METLTLTQLYVKRITKRTANNLLLNMCIKVISSIVRKPNMKQCSDAYISRFQYINHMLFFIFKGSAKTRVF